MPVTLPGDPAQGVIVVAYFADQERQAADEAARVMLLVGGGTLVLATLAAFIEKGLLSNGFTTTIVADGQGARDYALSGDFDLLVLDIGLPGLDGFGVLGAIRSAHSPIPILMLTARDGVQDTVAGLEGGVG